MDDPIKDFSDENKSQMITALLQQSITYKIYSLGISILAKNKESIQG
jgi:stress-induced morphogen